MSGRPRHGATPAPALCGGPAPSAASGTPRVRPVPTPATPAGAARSLPPAGAGAARPNPPLGRP
ncbi:hypothetical protein CLV63_11176 [Murinocardiopsis flavida]|uniref:Uncharacterized protein n=1 Tax=Murinocardiopsis flavida TaxID=645275 RepID=A0A2P8DH01_9ACTN|nr:hypothetical protein CLV63_11176 [Murinocardiopsis flavida]